MSGGQPPGPDFTGTVRLFPLPNLVLYPQVLQPLHIFEPRYRQLTRDALAGDRLIAMALLKPGWEPLYESRPPIHPVVCVSRIIAEQETEDGRFNLVIRGWRRARVLHELAPDKLYRLAAVELLEERPGNGGWPERQLRQRLRALVPLWLPDQPDALAQFQQLLQTDVSFGMFCDLIAFGLPLPPEVKQEVLAEPDVPHRAHALLAHLKSRQPKDEGKPFPPGFSPN